MKIVAIMETSAPKRLKLDPFKAVPKKQERRASEVVGRVSKQVHDYLNVPELLQYIYTPGLDFLDPSEIEQLFQFINHQQPAPKLLVSYVLKFLSNREGERRETGFRKFVACINKADEHRGHKELSKIILSKLGKEEKLLIHTIEDEADTPLPSPYTTPQHSPAHIIATQSPEKPIAFIVLEGELVEKSFMDMERKLWFSFNHGRYDELELLIKDAKDRFSKVVDCQVVVSWFKSLVMMHRHVKYPDAIMMLDTALDLVCQPDCVNRRILTGRILQRKAQIYLMMGLKERGAKDFEMAKEELQLVGRGYDKTNMYCREAKLLSATQPHRREDTEKVYEDALRTLEKDDPYFLASYPSVTLSKAAFHLHIAFGSKLTSKDKLPTVSDTEIQKARQTLSGFSEEEHILIDMRRLEYELIQAELCRLDGKDEEARSKFSRLKQARKTGNIASIAKHRLWCMSSQICT